jgi:hypothetical protein
LEEKKKCKHRWKLNIKANRITSSKIIQYAVPELKLWKCSLWTTNNSTYKENTRYSNSLKANWNAKRKNFENI